MSHQYTGSSLCWFVAAGHDQILQPPQLFHQRPATHTHIHTHTHTHAHTRTHTHTHKRTHAHTRTHTHTHQQTHRQTDRQIDPLSKINTHMYTYSNTLPLSKFKITKPLLSCISEHTHTRQ